MEKLPKISYKSFVLIFSLLGFLVSTLGLNLILQFAVPLLTFIYPTSIVLVLISLLSIFIKFDMQYTFIIPTIVTLIISVLQIAVDYDLLNILNSLYHLLPLANIQLAWLIPFIVLTIVGLVIDYFLSNNAKPETHQN